jgi:hypothetical protein
MNSQFPSADNKSTKELPKFNYFRQPPIATILCCVQCFLSSDGASTGKKLSIESRPMSQKLSNEATKPIFKNRLMSQKTLQ